MAEGALQKLEEQLNCSICLDTYTDPTLLQCFHVYCRQCLVPLVVRDQQGQLGISCPTCRQVTPVPERGVAGLQTAFHINHLLEIQASFQQNDDPLASSHEAAATSVDIPPKQNVRHCSEHPEEELKLFCETCGELVCFQCVTKYGKHYDHDNALLDGAFKRYREEVTPLLVPMEEKVATAEQALALIDAHCGEISEQRASTASRIHHIFRQLCEVLKTREAVLIGQLDQITQDKLKSLATQKDQIETTLAQLCSCLHFVRKSIEIGNQQDLLVMKPKTVRQVRELSTPFQPESLEPKSKPDIAFVTSTGITAVCQNYGQVVSLTALFPPKCHITEDVRVAVVGEKSSVTLKAITFAEQLCKESIESFGLELVSEITGTTASCSAERIGQSIYKINYQPTVKGGHYLHIKVDRQHINGSPFTVSAKSSVVDLSTPILTVGGVKGPVYIATTQKGQAVVSEWDSRRVSIFSPSGQKIQSLHTNFVRPHGVAVDDEGNIFITDSWTHCIQKFTAGGYFIKEVGTNGSGPLQFDFPSDVASANDKLYVVDGNNHRIQVLNSDLTLFNTFGSKGSHKGQFNHPRGIASDSTGEVYVTDHGNHRIQVFTDTGKFLRAFGGYGRSAGELNWPSGIAIDTSNLVYISEIKNHRISIFTTEGQFVASFGRKGKEPGTFNSPCGVAVDGCGVVYVADTGNNRVQIF